MLPRTHGQDIAFMLYVDPTTKIDGNLKRKFIPIPKTLNRMISSESRLPFF